MEGHRPQGVSKIRQGASSTYLVDRLDECMWDHVQRVLEQECITERAHWQGTHSSFADWIQFSVHVLWTACGYSHLVYSPFCILF